MTTVRHRALPWRSSEVWAREFVAACNDLGVTPAPTAAEVEWIAAKDERLRERLPRAVLVIVQETSRAFGVPVDEWVRIVRAYPWLLAARAKTVVRQLKEIQALLGFDATTVRQRLKTELFLLTYSGGALKRRMEELRLITGLPRSSWRRCVQRCPAVLAMKGASIRSLIKRQRQMLAVSAAEHAALVLREPRMLLRSPDAIEGFLAEMVGSWGLKASEARALVLKAPKLLCSGRAEQMSGNIDALATGFGVEKSRIVAAITSFPPLAYQKPARLLDSVRTGAAALGVPVATVMAAGLRTPSLLARRPEKWGFRMRLVIRIARALGSDLTATHALEHFPAALTYGQERLVQRYAMARLGIWRMNWAALLSLSDKRARTMLAAYFIEHEERRGMRHALIKRGLL